ncbi:MAG TPA: hypothetical protein VK809_02200 [Bacteroidia bacterium]|nr:hypothetical protein [Bacteroidia bacterium]
MNKRAKLFLLSVLLFSSLKGIAQHKDTAASGFLFELSYAGQLPGGDIGKLFGFNSNVQGGVHYKTQNNWVFGGEFSYMFGNYLRNTGILDSLATTNGNVIANDGNYPGVSYFETGFDIQLTVGKLFPVSKNLNSGILTMISAGYIQYHLSISAPSDWTPQISGDYLQGYEHLTAGACITEFIGYQYISKKSFVAFFGGFEFTEAMAKSLQYDFESNSKNPNYKFNMLSGIRVGWMLPILQENTKTPKFYTH